MSTPLLATKLYIPPPRPGLVARPRLLQKLDHGLQQGHRLFLVSAPAGAGKTTLVSEWVTTLYVERATCHVTWLSLDAEDNDPARFLANLAAALESIHSGICADMTALLQSPQPPPLRAILTALINLLAEVPVEFLLVLDDYHTIEAQAVHEVLAFLLDHLPQRMRLVIAGRTDPPLPLARMRARHQMTEIHAPDLRFTLDEAASFLNQISGLGLTSEDIAALEVRTEGWAAGLQLAALAIQNQSAVSGEQLAVSSEQLAVNSNQLAVSGDQLVANGERRSQITDFICAFTGSDRYVLDYLAEEVLHRQPESIQAFLLQTSILGRLCGPLCDGVVLKDEGERMKDEAVSIHPSSLASHPSSFILHTLEAANLFILPLDNERRWYRYHQLFFEFLRNRLEALYPPERIAELHRRAADWYEANALVSEAIKHALAAQDFERAARLIEKAARQTLVLGEVATLLVWLGALPESIIRERPHLCLARAWVSFITGQIEDVEPRLQEALEVMPAGDVRVLGEVAALQALIANLRGEPHRAIELARQALDGLPEDETFLRGLVALNQGLAYDTLGDMASAVQVYRQACAIGQASGTSIVTLMASVQLADLKVAQGRLNEAASVYGQAIQQATQSGKSLNVVSMAYANMGSLLYEWNDLDTAAHHLTQCIELGRQWGSADMLITGSIALAQVRQAQGDSKRVQELVRDTEQAFHEPIYSPPTISSAKAVAARLAVRQHDLDAAVHWLHEYEARPGQAPLYLRALEETTRARVLLALGKPEQASRALDPLLQAVEAAGRVSNTIEILALQALVLNAQKRTNDSLKVLRRALELAEPEGFVRTFVDEGEAMRKTLEMMKEEGERQKDEGGRMKDEGKSKDECRRMKDEEMKAYISKLLASFELPKGDQSSSFIPHPSSLASHPLSFILHPFEEPLSGRELDVLRLIADGRSNQEIAGQLYVALSTVKTHINNIYGKMGVQSRVQVVTRARDMNLL